MKLREAIHEVLKYTEAVKQHLSIRENELKLIVASTVWTELLVPFSHLVDRSDLNISGFELLIKPENQISALKIAPLAISRGRYIAPWHTISFYKDLESLNRGYDDYQKVYLKHKIDFILIELHASDDVEKINKENFKRTYTEMNRRMGKEHSPGDIENLIDQIEHHPFILYFGMQILDMESCFELIRDSSEIYQEATEIIPDMNEEEALCTLHSYINSLDPIPHSDNLEIGYPAKLESLLEQQQWSVYRVKRFGSFERNELLLDQKIINEFRGHNGNQHQKFVSTIEIANKSDFSQAKESIFDVLEDNDSWRNQILSNLEEIKKTWPNSKVDISIYNPSSGLISLFLMHEEDGLLYTPAYQIAVNEEGLKCAYLGTLGINEKFDKFPLNFQSVVKDFYDSDVWSFLFSLTWGGYEERDFEIMQQLGLMYKSYKVINNDLEGSFLISVNNTWEKCEITQDPRKEILDFFYLNPQFTEELVNIVDSNWVR